MNNQKKSVPVKISKRFLNEGLLRAGPVRFDFNNASMLRGGYSAQGLPAQGKPVTSQQLSNLRGAMIVRSMIESDAATVASISEDFAADLIGGENTNSRAFGGDNSKFSDVVVGNKYYSVKFRKSQKSNEFSQHKTDVFVKAMEAYGRNNEYGVILIDADPQRGGRGGAGFSLYVSPTIRGSDVRLEKNVRQVRHAPHDLFIGERAVGISNSFRTKKKIKEIFKGGEDININIATIEEINESINRLYEKDVDKSLTRGSGHDAGVDRSYFIINGKFDPMSKFISLIRDTSKSASNIIQVFPFFGKGLGAASARADIFIKSAGNFLSNDEDGDRREFVYTSSRLFKQIGTLMKFVDEYPGISKELKKELIKYYLEELKKITLELEKTINMTSTSPKLPLVDNSNLPGPFGQLEDLDLREAKNLFENKIKKINLKFAKLLLKEKKNRKKRSKCQPARRRINSGGEAGSYADPRTGGKQAYAALKKAKPPGSKGGWTKKKCICCHKCPNDRSAPNGFVCTNPSHLYWGTKADNTYDQNRGNGWAARNKNKNEGDPKGEKAFSYEIMVSEDKIRDAIKKIILEDAQSESWFGNSFVAFKKEVSKGKDPLKVAKKNLNEIGRGSTRVVFDLPDNDGFVLKIINTEVEPTRQAFIGPDGNVMSNVSPEGDFRTRHGFFRSHMRQSNEWEADLVMQQKFPDVFPKTFEKADDFSWILVEKALPVATLDELIDILGVTNTFSSSARNKKVQFIAMIKEAIEYFKNPDHRLRAVNESYDSTITGFNFDDKTNKETFSTDLFDVLPTQNNQELPSDTILVANDEPYTPVEDPHDKRVKELISNAHNRKILGAMSDLGIPPREFLPKNLGISSLTGKLLIIDASLWEEKKKVR